MRARFISLGCKVNQYETQALEGLFAQHGFFTETDGKADLVVINSCTVTSLADRKTRQIVRKLRRELPDAVLVLTGCMPQTSPEDAAALDEADIITGTKDRSQLVALVLDYFKTRRRKVEIAPYAPDELFEPLSAEKFDDSFQRAYLKIQDGCDRFCAYCIIPYARGGIRSRSLEQITAETQKLADAGYHEIVLTGINISRYGSDFGASLPEAVQAAASAHGNFRLRLGSVEPDLLTEADWQLLSKIPALCPHFHIPLQSGCDATLRRMDRHYSADDFIATVGKIRQLFPNPSITTDIIVGFPGETDEEFEQTCRTVERIGLLRAHIFEYSPRIGTPAAAMENQIPPPVKKQRARKLADLCTLSGANFASAQIGRRARVLLEATGGGYSDNYLYVNVPDRTGVFVGDFINVLLTASDGAACTGVLTCD
ncbi:tRNA (N(6)-L-threonylcarbamoyladenosine(37)-C(2))-methylthiotransferase MtaB [Oscillospiraceae bacterium MB24-C1]|nr:tRNA (N(6)-L-threonylcarbamoyladenosine(37)-C(2))-methylthiotransferase MtaB [Oscillospiraceae bacterium MB24-C1]